MKGILWLTLLVLMTAAYAQSGVYKKSETEVSFKGIGKYATKQVEKITANQKSVNDDAKFKGQGTMGFAANFFIKDGKKGEIIDLNRLTITSLDHKKKEYTVRAIQPLEPAESEEESGPAAEETEEEPPSDEENAEESNIRIIRQEFKVVETGKEEKINKFPCKQYIVYWITEWEYIDTGERGKDSLQTDVWSTMEEEIFQQAATEEAAFNQGYFKALGLDVDGMTQKILGTDWFAALKAFQGQSSGANSPADNSLEELKKIKGYPVLIDGRYFAIRPKTEDENAEAEEDVDVSDPAGMFGKFAKKSLFGKKKEEKEEPTFGWRTEIKDIKLQEFSETDFTAPSQYKLKE
jgi:hypothetical protein